MGASEFSKPQIALNLRSCGALLNTAFFSSGVLLRSSRESIQESLVSELYSRSVGDVREVAIRSILGFIKQLAESAEFDSLATIASLSGLPSGVLRSKESIMASYKAATLITSESERALLSDAVSYLADIGEVKWDLSSGRLASALANTWDEQVSSGELGEIESVIAELTLDGFDSETLVWAIIVFESCKHTSLVWMVANRLSKSGSFGERSPSDLLGYGWRGLRTALRHYDPATGFAFSTYGVTRITGEIRDGVRGEHVLPKRLTTYARKMASCEAELTHQLGRAPKLEELAIRMGEDLDKLKELAPRLVRSASLNELSLDGESGAPSWLVSTAPDPVESLLLDEVSEKITSALSTLTIEDRQAVQLLLIDGLSVSQARALSGASARQLRTRVRRATEQLRDELVDYAG